MFRSIDGPDHDDLALRLAAIERRLGAIMDHLGVEDVEPRFPEVERLARQGETIKAVRLYRQQTGAGLRAAKRAVDRMVGDDPA